MRLMTRKQIQALEGKQEPQDIESGLLWAREAADIPGTKREYTTYDGQVQETYRKYKGEADYGGFMVRVVVDTRAAFIAGEGVSVSAEDERFAAWARKFLDATKLSGSLFFDAVIGSEMSGRALFVLSPMPADFPQLDRVPYSSGAYKAIRKAPWSMDAGAIKINIGEGDSRAIPPELFVYLRLGGDDREWDQPTTKIGSVLTECESYDRALSDIRRTNYTSSRITPVFEVSEDRQVDILAARLKQLRWKIGQAFIGNAKFRYETSGTGAVENLKTEMASAVKAVSAVSGVPVHWIGWTDLMSNRATAEELYHTISNATSRERTIFSEGIRELLIKAQTIYIDAGGTEISEVNKDFGVSIASLDYGRFESMVRALSQAFADEAISIDDYRSFIPGIDPLRTKQAIEDAKKEAMDRLIERSKVLPPPPMPGQQAPAPGQAPASPDNPAAGGAE